MVKTRGAMHRPSENAWLLIFILPYLLIQVSLIPPYIQNTHTHQLLLESYTLGDTIELMEQFRREPLYKIVMERAKQLRLDGLGRTEAIHAAIRDRKYKINKFVPDKYEIEQSEEEEDDEEVE